MGQSHQCFFFFFLVTSLSTPVIKDFEPHPLTVISSHWMSSSLAKDAIKLDSLNFAR